MKHYCNKNSVSLQINIFIVDISMKNRFSFLLIIGIITIIACQKEPSKGDYTGRFEGYYTTDKQEVYYTTDYFFEIKKVTNNEIHLKEKASQTTSILQKKSNDSIVGMIGFGKIYNPSQDGSPTINIISVCGKHYKENAKTYISGTFSTTLMMFDTISHEERSYPSDGTFVLRSY